MIECPSKREHVRPPGRKGQSDWRGKKRGVLDALQVEAQADQKKKGGKNAPDAYTRQEKRSR